jgi:hypothetical protein
VRRVVRYALIVLLVSVGAAALPPVRTPLLKSLGHFLVTNETTASADTIVVAPESDLAGLIEAADLVAAGVSRRVAIFNDRVQPADVELRRRGIAFHDVSSQSVRILQALGVSDIEHIPARAGGTEQETGELAEWCRTKGFRSVVVVSSADHTRRLRRVLRRSFKGQPVAVTVRAARYSLFDPERWWATRDGARVGIVETEKLVLDFLRHPLG